MVIDTSALLAIILGEPEAADFLQRIRQTPLRRISAASFLEAGMVLCRDTSGERQRLFEELIRGMRLAIVPVTEEQARIALEAFSTYGKGKGHPAGLNFGDCFVYALAKVGSEPLLFKSGDFAHTDLLTVS